MPSCRLLAMLAAGAAATAALAGCGSDPVTVSGPIVRLSVDEYRIVPQDVRVRSRRFTLVVHDNGRLTHDVKLFSSQRTDPEGNPILLGGTATAHPGETVRATLRLAPGRYHMACTVANHEDLGQYGTLTVLGRS